MDDLWNYWLLIGARIAAVFNSGPLIMACQLVVCPCLVLAFACSFDHHRDGGSEVNGKQGDGGTQSADEQKLIACIEKGLFRFQAQPAAPQESSKAARQDGFHLNHQSNVLIEFL